MGIKNEDGIHNWAAGVGSKGSSTTRKCAKYAGFEAVDTSCKLTQHLHPDMRQRLPLNATKKLGRDASR